MAYSTRFHPKAAIEYQNATQTYQGVNNTLVRRFLTDFDHLFFNMERLPKMFPIRYDGIVRVGQLKRYPYLVHYIVDEAKQENIIMAFLHEKDGSTVIKNRY